MVKIKRNKDETDIRNEDAVPFDDFAVIRQLTSFRTIETKDVVYDVSYELTYIEDEGHNSIRSIVLTVEDEYKWKFDPKHPLITGMVAECVEKEFAKESEQDRWILLQSITKDILDLCVKEKINFD